MTKPCGCQGPDWTCLHSTVPDTVAVPDTGTYVVADGVVHEPTWVGFFSERDGTRRYTVKYTIEPPKPTFFEEGKTYTTTWGATFSVDRVKEERVAFGFYTDRDTPSGRWTMMGSFTNWKEVK